MTEKNSLREQPLLVRLMENLKETMSRIDSLQSSIGASLDRLSSVESDLEPNKETQQPDLDSNFTNNLILHLQKLQDLEYKLAEYNDKLNKLV